MKKNHLRIAPEWPHVSCDSPGGESQALISTYGAQVLSWRCKGSERLYLSPFTSFEPGKAIRGGIPVIFPQFGTYGHGIRHGFARLRPWHVAAREGLEANAVRLMLRDDAELRNAWPHPFETALVVSLPAENSLRVELEVRNTGETAMKFTAALHTYFRVEDSQEATLSGLQGARYRDAMRASELRLQKEAVVRFKGEVDRVYLGPPSDLVLTDDAKSLRILQSGFVDSVVWNPGAALADAMPDLGEAGHRHFVCVEAACVEHAIELPPDGTWCGSQTLIG